jgi:hypothetical protein
MRPARTRPLPSTWPLPVRQRRGQAARGQTAWLWVLVLALLAAQTLGLAHRVLHGVVPAPEGASVPAAMATTPVAGTGAFAFAAPLHWHADGERCDPSEAHADPWHDHDAGSAECRLVDQLAHADLCGAVPLQLPLAPTGERWTMPGAAADPPARACADYLARAPPRA